MLRVESPPQVPSLTHTHPHKDDRARTHTRRVEFPLFSQSTHDASRGGTRGYICECVREREYECGRADTHWGLSSASLVTRLLAIARSLFHVFGKAGGRVAAGDDSSGAAGDLCRFRDLCGFSPDLQRPVAHSTWGVIGNGLCAVATIRIKRR